MRAKKHHTSLPFLILITELCRRDKAPTHARKDVDVAPVSSTDFRKIEVEFLKNKEDTKYKEATDTWFVPIEISLHTPTLGPSVTTRSTTSFTNTSGSFWYCTTIQTYSVHYIIHSYHSNVFDMDGKTWQYVNCQAANIENALPTMIQTALDDLVAPLNATIET